MSTSQKTSAWRPPTRRCSTPIHTESRSTADPVQEILQSKGGSLLPLNGSTGALTVERDEPKAVDREAWSVLIADDHPVVREGLVTLIERQPDMRVVAQASNGREALEQFLVHHPDVTLLDVRMCIMDGIDTLTSIREKDPLARVAIITSYQSEEDIYRALRAGAQGYILKDAEPGELAQCIRAVGCGRTWIPAQVGAKLAKRVADRELTPRETDVLGLVAAGKSNKEIGVAFGISEATVKVHMTHLLEKLKVAGRTEAINVAVKRGLVRLDVSPAA
jgi:two-component system, NarL family, response regulator